MSRWRRRSRRRERRRNTRQTNAFNHKGKRRNPISRRSRIYREGKVGWRNRILVNRVRLHRKQHDDRGKKMHRTIPEDRKWYRPVRGLLLECSSPYVMESKVTCRASSMLSNLFRIMKREVIAYSAWDAKEKTGGQFHQASFIKFDTLNCNESIEQRAFDTDERDSFCALKERQIDRQTQREKEYLIIILIKQQYAFSILFNVV